MTNLVNCFVLIITHTVAVVNKCFSILQGFFSIHWLLHDDFCICTLRLLMFLLILWNVDCDHVHIFTNGMGMSREHLCWAGYQVCKLKSGSGPGGVYLMLTQYFQFWEYTNQ